ncbi:MAG: hypothetical protein JO317_02510, partial [Verrucomicrobiae bacterium]|nr:hypothetical protein [Verrucomicrobiae bacterium]
MIFRYLYRRRLQRLAGAAIPPEKMKKLVATLGEWTALKLLLSGSVPEQAAGPDVPVWKQIGKNSG